MKKLLASVVIGILVGSVFAGTGGIAGRVSNVATGEPVVNAIVTACSDSLPAGRAVTNEQGEYLIEGLNPGEYRVIARARGFVPAHSPVLVVVREGNITEGVDLRLRPLPRRTGAISGRVVDRITREPLRGAVVIVRNQAVTRRARTDRNGYYIIRGLGPGRYQVAAKARRYFGEVLPDPVEVVEGEVTENINFALQPKPRRGGISGQVVDVKAGSPIAGVLITALGPQGSGFARTNGNGFYQIVGLEPGRYTVSATKPGYQAATYPEPVEVNAGELTRGIDFRLQPLRNNHTDTYTY